VTGRDDDAAGEPSIDVVVASSAESAPPQLLLDVGGGAPARPVLAQEPRADRALEGSDRGIEIAVFDDDPMLRHSSQLGQHLAPFRRIQQMEKSDAEDGRDAVRAKGKAARVRPQKREPRPLRPKFAPGHRQHGGRDIGRDDAEGSLQQTVVDAAGTARNVEDGAARSERFDDPVQQSMQSPVVVAPAKTVEAPAVVRLGDVETLVFHRDRPCVTALVVSHRVGVARHVGRYEAGNVTHGAWALVVVRGFLAAGV
jgi:hypothetical protein